MLILREFIPGRQKFTYDHTAIRTVDVFKEFRDRVGAAGRLNLTNGQTLFFVALTKGAIESGTKFGPFMKQAYHAFGWED